MKKEKVYKTKDGTILIVTADTDGTNSKNRYVSVTANEIEPITRESAIKQCREHLEDGELWKMAVEANQTELGLSDWLEFVLGTDGELSGFDNSLYPVELNIEGTNYLFDSRACGCLHDQIKQVTNEFNTLIDLHLKCDKKSITKAENIIKKLKSANIDKEVEIFTREILSIES